MLAILQSTSFSCAQTDKQLDPSPKAIAVLKLTYHERNAMIENKVLYDGMAIEEAQKILGPPNPGIKGYVVWYWNPGNRLHVAPFIGAQEKGGKLYEWQTGNR